MLCSVLPYRQDQLTVKIRVQSNPRQADEVVMLEDFADTVRSLTNGEVDIEVLPAGAVVGVKETLKLSTKVSSKGLCLDPYWSGYHPAAMCSVPQPLVAASESTTSRGFPGICMVAASRYMTSCGRDGHEHQRPHATGWTGGISWFKSQSTAWMISANTASAPAGHPGSVL